MNQSTGLNSVKTPVGKILKIPIFRRVSGSSDHAVPAFLSTLIRPEKPRKRDSSDRPYSYQTPCPS